MMFAKPGVAIAALFALLLALGAAVSHAYEVGPMRVILVPSEGRLGGTIRINNTRDTALPVEMKFFRRIVERDGTQRFEPADDQFTVFPLQASVAAASSQAVRFQYTGERTIDVAQAYVLQVTEVPVTPPGFSGVTFTYNFGVAIYVDPPRAAARIAVDAVERRDGAIMVTVTNSGNQYASVAELALLATSGGATTRIEPADLKTRLENPLVPPGATRDIVIAMPELTGTEPVAVEFRAAT